MDTDMVITYDINSQGLWVLLQNCHLGLEYMVEVMEQFGELEKDPEKIHETFR